MYKLYTNKSRMKQIITVLTPNDLKSIQSKCKDKILVIKYTASWCGPCKTIKPMIEEYFSSMPDNVLCADLDVDDEDNMDLYSVFHKKRMLSGIPAIFVFYGDVEKDFWYVPDETVCGSDIQQINSLFSRIKTRSAQLRQQ